MNVREAEKIRSYHHWNDPIDFQYGTVKGFLDCHELYKPLVEAAKRVLFEGTTESEASAIEQLEDAMNHYRTHILGEESK